MSIKADHIILLQKSLVACSHPRSVIGTIDMNFSPLLVVFLTVFLAELGDKTQLATVLFATDGQNSPWLVFVAASLALVGSTAIAVLFGTFASTYLEVIPLKLIAGMGFIAIGLWTVFEYAKG